jgi:Spermine/spermidine synthase domain
VVFGVLAVSWILFCAGCLTLITGEANTGLSVAGYTIVSILFLLIIPAFLWIKRDFWRTKLRTHLDKHTRQIDALPSSQLWFWIALIAGVGLFAELMMIRLHSSFFQLFAYFKNVSLLSCFLGLGIGYIRGSRAPLLTPYVMPLFGLQIALMHLYRFSPVANWLHNPVSEQFTFGIDQATGFGNLAAVYGFLLFIFSLNAIAFVPLGQLASRLMMRRDKLESYSWNLIGSLAGIVIFSVISFAWSPPWVWVVLLAIGLGAFLFRQWTSFLPTVAITGIISFLLIASNEEGKREIYSPYQILQLIFSDGAPPELLACNTYHQKIVDLSNVTVTRNPMLQPAADYYGMPYEFVPTPENVLIVGSGTGNDVAAALRANARHIDAVEIDPAILACGREFHPEHPYDALNVSAIVDDARSYLRHTEKKYDLIVYGLLDSHSLLSGKSGGVRLDSYVYTVEGLKDARSRLKPDGVISLSFCVMKRELGRKLFLMLTEAFNGKSPLVFESQFDGSTCFVIGDKLSKSTMQSAPRLREITALVNDSNLKTDVSTDDWPFFYMAQRQYPLSYVGIIVVLAIVSWLYVRQMAPGADTGFSVPCFFLGAGFMLVETKSITELALVYGSTWIVISVVVAAILVMAFMANLLVMRFGSPRPVLIYTFLGASLLMGLGHALFEFSDWPAIAGKIAMTVILTLPLFFSGFAFSSELKKSASVAVALSSNLLGAMLGGLLEYNAMYFGYQSLYLLALVMYAIAFLRTAKTTG